MIYLLNSPVLTHYGTYGFSGSLSIDEVNVILEQGFESAIGHKATVEVINLLLKHKIDYKRQSIQMQKGDQAIVFRLLKRLPLDKEFTAKELLQMPYEFSLLKRTN